MTITLFIDLCHSREAFPYDRTKNRLRYEKDPSGVLRPVTDDPMINRLKSILTPLDGEERIGKTEIERWKIGFVNHWKLHEDEGAKSAYDILTALTGLLGSLFRYYRPLDRPEWIEAISLLKGYLDVDRGLIESDDVLPNKYKERAEAALKLRAMGYSVETDELDVKIDVDSVYRTLDERVRKYGGIQFIETLFSLMEYNPLLGRLILPKNNGAMISREKIEYDCPVNYIFNLALKNASYEGERRFQTNQYFQDTLDLFSLLCYASYEVQGLGIWDNVFYHDKDKLSYIRDIIYRESIYNLHQSSVKFICSLIRFIAKKEKAENGNQFSDLFNLLYYLLAHSNPRKFERIDPIEIPKRIRLVTPDVTSYFEHVTISVNILNQGFLAPTDYDKVNFWNHPVIKMTDGSYLMMPSTILSRCCLEALLSFLRDKMKDFDSKFGKVLEYFIYGLFERKGIDVLTGEYSFNANIDGKDQKIKGECDGLIEFDTEIILLEMKKKSLIRTSRSGDIAQILTDLGATLLDSQKQGLKTQLALSLGHLELISGDHSCIVEQRGRTINKWTVTLLPFGDVQDKLIIFEILKIFQSTDFGYSLGDESRLSESEKKEHLKKKEKIENLNKSLKEFRSYIEAINKDRLFQTSLFMDAEEIMHLLQLCPTKCEFIKTVSNLRTVSFCTFDFFNELILSKRLRK